MIWTAADASNLSCPMEAQLDFQLHAMARTIKRIEQLSTQQTNDLSRLCIQRCEKSLVVKAAASTEQPATRSLVLTPLFAGSYTQPDVAVQRRYFTQESYGDPANDYRNMPLTYLCPPVPALHFAQFRRPKASWKLGSTMRDNTIVVLATDNLKSESSQEQASTSAHLLTEIVGEHPDCTIVVIDLKNFLQTYSSSCAIQQIRHRVRLHQYASSVPVNIKTIRLLNDEVTTLVTLLHQADVVYAPTAGLTIDALNSGCGVIMGNYPISVQKDSTEQIEIARQILAVEQMKHLQAHQMIHCATELYSLLHNWLQPKGWGKGTEAIPMNSIIPLKTQRTHGTRNSLVSGKAKLLKFHRSPRQFLQDSRFPMLRKFGVP